MAENPAHRQATKRNVPFLKMTSEHSKIINQVASQILKPNGLERKGQSRIWLDDNGWFTTTVEFQPHSGGHGTYLNVGVGFHWYLQDFITYDIGHRESELVVFNTVEQFTPEVEKLAHLAVNKVVFYRQAMRDIDTATQTILNHEFTSENLWGSFHKGTICGLLGNINGLNNYFDRLLQFEDYAPYVTELKERTKKLKDISIDTDKFKQHVYEIITETRKLKRLKELQIIIK
jgi:hypothetical protein